MNEKEWMECTDPEKMLDFVRGKASDRKFRLFSCACCRHLPFGKDERFHQALETTEQFADGLTTKVALKRGRQAVRAARFGLTTNSPKVHGEWSTYWLAEVAASENAYPGVVREIQRLAHGRLLNLPSDYHSSICAIVREIFSNAFLNVRINRLWLTPTVKALAQAIYDDRNFTDMPILADALEEAGCTNEDILNHCRGPGEHVRGCWALDLVLGKE